jgi:hypothetical protein
VYLWRRVTLSCLSRSTWRVSLRNLVRRLVVPAHHRLTSSLQRTVKPMREVPFLSQALKSLCLGKWCSKSAIWTQLFSPQLRTQEQPRGCLAILSSRTHPLRTNVLQGRICSRPNQALTTEACYRIVYSVWVVARGPLHRQTITFSSQGWTLWWTS